MNTLRHYGQRLGVVLLVVAVAWGFGCGNKGRVPVYPVSGKVLTADKKPAVGAMVTLHPVSATADNGLRPVGRVDADGFFQLTTYMENDGAPAGEYVATVVWPTPKKTPLEPEGPDRLGGKYARPETSPFKLKIEPSPQQELPPLILP